MSESFVRYSQVWEDGDILLDALDVRPGDVCVSIASAGDNTLALLTRAPSRVIALDVSPAQIACLELRVAAYRTLSHPEALELLGSRPSTRRGLLYARCRPVLSAAGRGFWDRRPNIVAGGIAGAGKFERYLRMFRRRVLPLVHDRTRVAGLVQKRSKAERVEFYQRHWNTWRWRLLFRLFFSRAAMGRLGRDPGCFRHVRGDVAVRLLDRTRYALTELDPSENPYIHWILTGTHGESLPCALREEHFETIRTNLDRLSWHCTSLEAFLASAGSRAFDRFNLSDMFEYVSEDHYHSVLASLVRVSRPGARLAYWNLLAERRRPAAMADRLRSLDALARTLHRRDRAFFYSALRVEEVQ